MTFAGGNGQLNSTSDHLFSVVFLVSIPTFQNKLVFKRVLKIITVFMCDGWLAYRLKEEPPNSRGAMVVVGGGGRVAKILAGGLGGPTFLFLCGLRNDRDNKFYCGLPRDR